VQMILVLRTYGQDSDRALQKQGFRLERDMITAAVVRASASWRAVALAKVAACRNYPSFPAETPARRSAYKFSAAHCRAPNPKSNLQIRRLTTSSAVTQSDRIRLPKESKSRST
jgi:hypothetical protein